VAVQYYDELLRYCRRLTSDGDIVHDVVQEAYQRFLAAQHAGKRIVSPRELLRTIVRHVLVDMHRRAKVRDHVSLEDMATAQEPLDAMAGPSEMLAARQMARAYDAKIQALPKRCREAFMLCMFDDLSYAQIAEHMGISCSMVEKHMARALLACRQCQRGLAAQD